MLLTGHGRLPRWVVMWCAVGAGIGALALTEGAARAQIVDIRAGVGLEGDIEVNGNDVELDPSVGIDASYVRDVAPYVALGGGLGLWSWIAEADNDNDGARNLIVDLSFRPEGHLNVADSTQLFAALPIGLSYSTIGDDTFVGGDIDPAFGFHVAFEVGTRIILGSHGGLEVALGVIHHDAEHEVDTVVGSGTLDGSMTQFLLRVGGFFYAGS